MPIRAVVSPKFTYSQSTGFLSVYRGTGASNPSQNGMFRYDDLEDLSEYVYMPTIAFPAIGNGHSARKSNRITVTSIRIKMTFQALQVHLQQTNWFASTTYTPTGSNANIPLNPQMFAKFRLYVVQVDDDIPMTRQKFLNWFYATHCVYRNYSVAEEIYGPDQGNVTPKPGPTSVHSSVLRTTTPWTGKFNILADRKFILNVRRPQFDIDMTIPLRKEYVFDEQYDANSKLLYPKLYVFILPPLSFEVDVDPWTYDACIGTSLDQNIEKRLFRVYCWSKLNFVDL